MKYFYILLTLLYIFFPYDLLPDFLGGWGRIDDLVVLGFLLRFLFMQHKRPQSAGQTRTRPGPAAEKPAAGEKQNPAGDRFDSDDPYTVLGVDRAASEENVRKAYRELVNKYHPDKVEYLGEEFKALAEKRFKQIQHAYQSIPKTRR
ncbi:MAG: DnaJ domain-containing protein [Desulfobacterales bacterium]